MEIPFNDNISDYDTLIRINEIERVQREIAKMSRQINELITTDSTDITNRYFIGVKTGLQKSYSYLCGERRKLYDELSEDGQNLYLEIGDNDGRD